MAGTDLKFCLPIPYTNSEGTVSQIPYLGLLGVFVCQKRETFCKICKHKFPSYIKQELG